MIRRSLDLLYLGAGYIAGIFLVVIFGLMMLLSVGRDINFNVPSGDDFAGWAFAAMAFFGLAHTFKKGEMIRVGLLIERLHGSARKGAELFSLTVAALFIGYFTRPASSPTIPGSTRTCPPASCPSRCGCRSFPSCWDSARC